MSRGPLAASRAAAILSVLALACPHCLPAQDPPAALDLPKGTVLLPNGRSLSVEVAATPQSITRGYMFREKVPEGEGMVFFLGRLDIHYFWMKNCLTALDIVWLDENWRIVHIEADVPPCKADPCPSYAPMRKSLYVLEIGPGQAKALSLSTGDVITFIAPEKAESDPSGP